MKLLTGQKGFTLLEVMIAFALLTIILTVAVVSQSASLASSARSRNILIANSLARNFMNEQEVKYDGLDFEQLPKSTTGNFPDANSAFKWTLTFEEVDFSVLSNLIAKEADNEKQEKEANQETVVKMFEDYLKRSVRRMTLTVEYPDSGSYSKLSFTQLLVNYDADFATGM